MVLVPAVADFPPSPDNQREGPTMPAADGRNLRQCGNGAPLMLRVSSDLSGALSMTTLRGHAIAQHLPHFGLSMSALHASYAVQIERTMLKHI